MGRKRTRTWLYLYLSIACMIFISLAGCATQKEMEAKGEPREYFTTAQKLLDQGDYEGSLRENEKVLSLYDNIPLGDEALFNIGLIYAHHGNLKRDYKKSLNLFKILLMMFPQSPLVGQAKLWIGILQENQSLNREIEELNKTIKKSKQVDIEIEEKKELWIGILKENQSLNREIEELNKTIKKSKQVDIEIEEKKEELSK